MGISVFRDFRGARELVGRIEFARGQFARFTYDAT